MSVTPETVRCVLRSWIAIEVLTPQITKDGGWSNVAADRGGRVLNRKTDAQDGPTLWRPPQDDDPPPWLVLFDPLARAGSAGFTARSADPDQILGASGSSAKKERPWYFVILAAMPAAEAFSCLDAVFQDETDEDQTDRKLAGHVIAASVVLDEWGVMVPDSIAIASFAWGVGHMLGGGTPAGLAEWDEREQALKARFSDLLTPLGRSGEHRSLTWNDLRGASRELATELGLPDHLWVHTPCAIEIIRHDPPSADILSSFYLPDLGRVLRSAESLPAASLSYLGLAPPVDPWDALSDRRRALGPSRPCFVSRSAAGRERGCIRSRSSSKRRSMRSCATWRRKGSLR